MSIVLAAKLRGKHSAFTLVEALVVVAVVALLVALFAPTLSKSRASARGAVCLSNQRQLLIAWTSYVDDFRSWPLPIDPSPHFKLDYGWGGVHWFGTAATAGGLLPIPHERPLNPYIRDGVRIEAREAVFRCPSDDGAFNARTKARPWDAASSLSQAPDQDRFSCYSVSGVSYISNEWMYCKVGSAIGFGFAPPGQPYQFFRPNQGPQHVLAATSRFVVFGDIGSGSSGRITEGVRQSRDEFTAWWHGYEKCQLAFLDGSVRLERMGAVTKPGYTFYLDPSRQPPGSRIFAYTW